MTHCHQRAAGVDQRVSSAFRTVSNAGLLSSMAEPSDLDPDHDAAAQVLTMIAIDPERATGHELAAQLKVCRWPPCPAWSIDSWNTEW